MWSLYCKNVPASEYIPVYYAVNSQKKIYFRKTTGGARKRLLEAHLHKIVEAHCKVTRGAQGVRLQYLPEAHIGGAPRVTLITGGAY